MFFTIIYELFFVENNYEKIKYQNFKGYLLIIEISSFKII